MCLLVPPRKGSKGHKSSKSKSSPQTKPVAVPAIPTHSRMPQSKTSTSSVTYPLCQTECLVDYLKERYPAESTTWEQYSHNLALRNLDEHVHTQFDRAKAATEDVGKGVKAIQERLEKMDETLKVTDEAAKAAKDFGEETKKLRSAKADERKKMKEEAARSELERLKGLVEKQQKEDEERKSKPAQKKGLEEADVLKLMDERDMRLELKRLQGLQEAAVPKHSKDCLAEADLVKILDRRDHEREHARLQALEGQRAEDSKQDDVKMQEVRFFEILKENEQRKEFERLKAFEAETLKHATDGHSRPNDTVTPSLAEFERVIERILERHDLTRRFEENPNARGTRQRRETSPAAGPNREAETQRTIDQILETLLQQQQHVGKATELLERLLYKTKQDSRSDRHSILTEVLAYVDEHFLPEQRQGEPALDDLGVKEQAHIHVLTTTTPRLLHKTASQGSARQGAGSQCAHDFELRDRRHAPGSPRLSAGMAVHISEALGAFAWQPGGPAPCVVSRAGTDQVGREYCFLLGLSRVWEGLELAEPMWEYVQALVVRRA